MPVRSTTLRCCSSEYLCDSWATYCCRWCDGSTLFSSSGLCLWQTNKKGKNKGKKKEINAGLWFVTCENSVILMRQFQAFLWRHQAADHGLRNIKSTAALNRSAKPQRRDFMSITSTSRAPSHDTLLTLFFSSFFVVVKFQSASNHLADELQSERRFDWCKMNSFVYLSI